MRVTLCGKVRRTAQFPTTNMQYAAFLKRFGAAVKRRRKSIPLSQDELASRAETDQSTISRIERGEQGFDGQMLISISAALGTPLSVLVAEVENAALKTVPDEAAKLLDAFMALPPKMRVEYSQRIQALAIAHQIPVPDEELAHLSIHSRKKKAHA